MKANKLIISASLSALLAVESADSMQTSELGNLLPNKKLQQIEINSDKYKEAVSEVAIYYMTYTDIFGCESNDLNSDESDDILKRIAYMCDFTWPPFDKTKFIEDISKEIEIQRLDQLQTLRKNLREKVRIAVKN